MRLETCALNAMIHHVLSRLSTDGEMGSLKSQGPALKSLSQALTEVPLGPRSSNTQNGASCEHEKV